MIDDVMTNTASTSKRGGELDLCSNDIGGGDQHRMIHLFDGRSIEQSTEGADPCQNRSIVRRTHSILHEFNSTIACVDIYPSGGILRFCHWISSKAPWAISLRYCIPSNETLWTLE